MSKNSGNKKLVPVKGNSSSNNSKLTNNNNKDSIKSFIDSEFNKFQTFQANKNNDINMINNINNIEKENTSIKSISLLKDDMKKIKGLNKVNETNKNDEAFKISQTKFRMPEMKNLNNVNSSISNQISDTTIANQFNSRPKTPFTIKKFETESTITKEVIDNLNKLENINKKRNNFDYEIAKDILTNSSHSEMVFSRTDKQYPNKNDNIEDEEYYEDFVDDEELKKVEIEKDNKAIYNNKTQDVKFTNSNMNKIYNDSCVPVYSSKKVEVYGRIRGLGIKLEEETFPNLFQLNSEDKNYVSEKISKGIYKNVIIQTKEFQNKEVETEKIDYKENYSMTDEISITSNKIKHHVLISANEPTELYDNPNDSLYQPLSFDNYKFFFKFSPYVEKILLNNINKFILQIPQDLQELKAFTKLEKDFTLQNNLIEYLNLNKQRNHDVIFNNFLFFDVYPMLIGISLTINYSDLNLNESNTDVNIIIIYNLFTFKEEKIFYSYSKITHMVSVGSGENLIIACNSEYSIDIFNMKNTSENYCQIFENKLNPTYLEFSNKILKPDLQYRMCLPEVSSNQIFNSRVLSIHKKYMENSNNTNVKSCKLYMMDTDAIFVIFEICENININNSYNYNFPLKKIYEINLQTSLSKVFFSDNLSINKIICKGFNLSKKYSNSYTDILYVSTNYGLVKVYIQCKDEITLNVIHSNSNDFNIITSFDVSDTGHLFISYSDFTIKILSEDGFVQLFQTTLSTLSHDTYIDKIICSDIICKNEKSKLIRKSLIANFYVISSKNEFILFDLHQKNKSDLKKIKKKIDLGQKKGLTKRNSLLTISDSLFFDFSNYIVQSDNKEKKVEFFKLSLRKNFYDITNIKLINEKIIDKLLK